MVYPIHSCGVDLFTNQAQLFPGGRLGEGAGSAYFRLKTHCAENILERVPRVDGEELHTLCFGVKTKNRFVRDNTFRPSAHVQVCASAAAADITRTGDEGNGFLQLSGFVPDDDDSFIGRGISFAYGSNHVPEFPRGSPARWY